MSALADEGRVDDSHEATRTMDLSTREATYTANYLIVSPIIEFLLNYPVAREVTDFSSRKTPRYIR
mgnify:CR=1 FL=1